MDHGDPAGARDQGRQQVEAVDQDLDAGLDAEHRQLPGHRGGVGPLVDGPGQGGELVERDGLADLGVVLGHRAQPAVAEQLDGGQAGDDPVRQEHAVDGGQLRRRVVHDRDRVSWRKAIRCPRAPAR